MRRLPKKQAALRREPLRLERLRQLDLFAEPQNCDGRRESCARRVGKALA